MARAVRKAEVQPDEVEEDHFIKLVQDSIEDLLKLPFDRLEKDAVKERNISIANAIRFLAVRNKVSGGDDDGFFGNN